VLLLMMVLSYCYCGWQNSQWHQRVPPSLVDGHGGLPVQYKVHRPMQHVQGYFGSHWMPASGDYLLRITPVAARATGKQTTINKYTYQAGRFDGHGDVPVRNRVHCLMEEVQGFARSHWMLPSGKYYVQ
jgi:hypothetical protein